METITSRIFLVKWHDKGKVAHVLSKLKTQGTVKWIIVISIIPWTSFINSETNVLLHLKSLTEDMSLSQILAFICHLLGYENQADIQRNDMKGSS